MNLEEFNGINTLTYFEYVNYLKHKYGEAQYDYMTKSLYVNPKVRRTKEGLVCHHVYEYKAINLSQKEFAMQLPFEYQKAENLVYCDYLEHLWLHFLISFNYRNVDGNHGDVGIGGFILICNELNDIYSGMKPTQEWKQIVLTKVIRDSDVYIEIMKCMVDYLKSIEDYINLVALFQSFSEKYGCWNNNSNQSLYDLIIDKKELSELLINNVNSEDEFLHDITYSYLKSKYSYNDIIQKYKKDKLKLISDIISNMRQDLISDFKKHREGDSQFSCICDIFYKNNIDIKYVDKFTKSILNPDFITVTSVKGGIEEYIEDGQNNYRLWSEEPEIDDTLYKFIYVYLDKVKIDRNEISNRYKTNQAKFVNELIRNIRDELSLDVECAKQGNTRNSLIINTANFCNIKPESDFMTKLIDGVFNPSLSFIFTIAEAISKWLDDTEFLSEHIED